MMYGPSASLLLSDRLTFSVSYLYGVLGARYDTDFIESNGDTNLKVEYHFTGYARTVRHDLDTALSYTLSGNFKLFAGFKYQPLTMKVNKRGGFWDLNDITGAREPDEFYYIDSNELTFKQRNYAPGVGLGYTHAVSDTFTLTVNVSFICFFGTFDIDTGNTYYYPASPNPGDFLTPSVNQGSSFSFASPASGSTPNRASWCC